MGRRTVRSTAALAIMVGLLASCSSDGDDDGDTLTDVPDDCRDLARAAGVPDNAPLVAIKNNAYDPATLNVPRNTTIYWVNCDNVNHTVAGQDGTWRSPEFGRGGTFSRSFPQPGTESYFCVLHTTMRGTIVSS